MADNNQTNSDQVPMIGLYGLAVMGQNLALNIAQHAGPIAVCNRTPEKVDTCVKRAQDEGNLPVIGYKDVAEFVASLQKPRKIIMLIKAGKPVDDTISILSQHLESGDMLIDGGNEWFPESIRRANSLTEKGINYVGMGISGGEEGARNGPSLMPGGPRDAYEQLEPILTKIAAKAEDGEPCVTWLGEIGSGNYVKMVHNGIEYADMQLIAEAYDVLRQVGIFSNEELAKVFEDYNKSELESFLIEISAKIFTKKDDRSDEGYLIDKVLDKTGMKGTGKWTVQEAAERSVSAPTIAAALDARYISGIKEDRVNASKILNGPVDLPAVDKQQLIADVRDALYAAKICCYAQGMNIIKSAGKEMGWDVNLGDCARIWRGGCIIRAKLLTQITAAYERNPELSNLMVDPNFATDMNRRQAAWRRIVSLCVACGIATPAMSSSLAYFDSYRRSSLPANLTQAQRDFFGAHTYERVDASGSFHAEWNA